ncbi:two-component sensor histidine kinase (plasmid) [Paraburkholderia sp. PGU19]|uniref:ATP-binding protein n=1 Tax=Paraburkholderia sp. PGU19 TaxID=2735434 RepID=UPI0015DA025B|nr:ATP-binding protein [Paraburkholderia sp. PGU19]BCG04327.1 two-component sensor histidine kinase [Paraburkholderia sp. PGU19]
MFRMLVRLYAVAALVMVTAVVTINKAGEYAFADNVAAQERETSKGEVQLIAHVLNSVARSEWENRLRSVERLTATPISLVPVTSLKLDSNEQDQLLRHRIVVAVPDYTKYLLLADGETVLQARKLGVRRDMRLITFVAWLVLALTMLLTLITWVRFLWRDLEVLKDAARKFGGGELTQRAVVGKHSNVRQLAEQWNTMAERVQRMVAYERELLHAVSHELRTPISRIGFGLALLEEDSGMKSNGRRIHSIAADLRELDELVNELLTLGSLEHAASRRPRVPVSVRELIDDAVESFAEEMQQDQVVCELDLDPAIQVVQIEPKLTARTLMNLVKNAMKYGHGHMRISTRSAEAGTWAIFVDDDGPGIPQSERLNVFEPFYRLDQSRTRETGGFGLGLSIVRTVVEAQGGTVSIDTSPLGGARFVLKMPK